VPIEEVDMAGPTPIRPYLWFHDSAQEAMEYYVTVFPNSSIDRVAHYPDEHLSEHFEGMSGKVINGEFTLNGTPFGCIDGGPAFTFTEAVSFVIECADQAEIDHYWQALSAVPDAEACGWCKDRFGVSWQVVPAGLDLLQQRPEQIQALMHMKRIVIDELENA
jgi:predicted 3-demethylubiquinone-9 3-methyltransferase (glyoxalase superfamily)